MYLEILAKIRSTPPLRTVCYFSGLAASRCTTAADLKNCILYSITRLSVRAASSYNSKRIPRIPREETLLSIDLSLSLSLFLSFFSLLFAGNSIVASSMSCRKGEEELFVAGSFALVFFLWGLTMRYKQAVSSYGGSYAR